MGDNQVFIFEEQLGGNGDTTVFDEKSPVGRIGGCEW